MIDGYATLFDELQEPWDVILVPIGVGSLGAAAARYGAASGATVIGVEPETAACLTAALQAGEPVEIDVRARRWPASTARSSRRPPGRRCSPGIRGTITVSDVETHAAMAELADAGLSIGESGAAPLAALAALEVEPGTRVLLIATEGPTDRRGLRRDRRRLAPKVGDGRRTSPSARNTLLLAVAMAVYSSVLQLVAAVSSITFVLVTGVTGLLGLGPAIFLSAARSRRCRPGG